MLDFARLVRARQLNTRQIVIEWLRSHVCVSAMQLAAETDFYYTDTAFRAVIWRMVHTDELEPINKRKIYRRALIKPQRARIPDQDLRDEIGLVVTAMPIAEVCRLYEVSYSTVARANRELRQQQPELGANVAHKKNQAKGYRYGTGSSWREHSRPGRPLSS